MLGISLAACAPRGKFATVDEFCEALPEQKHVVIGLTEYDQPWIDDTSEAVISGCNRDRPQPRPAEWDIVPKGLPTHNVGGKTVPLPPAPAKPRSLYERAKETLSKHLKKRTGQ